MVAARSAPRTIDFTLMILALTVTVLGILLVFDASYNYALQMRMSTFRYVGQQAMWAVVGVVAMIWAAYYPYWKWRALGLYGVAISFLLLVLVLIPHIGTEVNGAYRWISIGPLRIQPSEFAKLAVVLYVAHVCAGRMDVMRHFGKCAWPKLRIIGILAALTAVEPDLGTSIVLFVGGLGAMFFAGMKFRHAVATLLAALALVGLLLGFKSLRHHSGPASSSSFQVQRLLVFLHPEKYKQGDGYQVFHSLVALGSGGLLGRGIGEGREKMYLPEAHTDFIFSVLGEECGLVGSLIMLALLAALVGRGFHIAASSKDPYGALLAAGISMIFGLQTFINIGVVTSSIPATGVPLPFESYGGSSLVISLIMIGILLNVARFPQGDPAQTTEDSEAPSARDFDRRWNRGSTLSRPEYRQDRVYTGDTGSRFSAAGTPRYVDS